MVNVNLLKSEIFKKGYNLCTFCKQIGMPQSTFTRRMKQGVFKTNEVDKMVAVLELNSPHEIFFAPQIT